MGKAPGSIVASGDTIGKAGGVDRGTYPIPTD